MNSTALDIDAALDRRLLRRKLSFWRVAAIFVLGLAIIAALSAAGAFSGLGSKGAHIARVSISGMITDDRPLLKMLDDIRKDDTVKGLLLDINSPGGTTVGGEAIFNAVREVAEEKPVVASIGTLAASAGYMIATASDRIFARRSSIVGSIGVIFQYPQASDLLDKIGVQMKEVKSSALKAEPSPFHPAPPEAIAVLEDLIDDSYQWFVDLVTERRPLTRSEVLTLADGRIYSGDRGLKTKLIDEIGGENEAKDWLIAEKGLDEGLELKTWRPKRPSRAGFPFASALVQFLGFAQDTPFTGIDPQTLPAIIPKRLFLDGLLSIKQ